MYAVRNRRREVSAYHRDSIESRWYIEVGILVGALVDSFAGIIDSRQKKSHLEYISVPNRYAGREGKAGL